MDTISDYLAFSQIPESGPINVSLYITGSSLSTNNISFTYHECSYEFCLTCVVQLCTYLKIKQSITSCTVLPFTLLQETIFFKTHRSKQQTFLRWCSDRG